MIVSILGKAGKDKTTGKFTTSRYEVDESLTHLVKAGDYYNATHALIENNPDEDFVFLYTEASKDYQKAWMPEASSQYRFVEIEGDDPEKIFDTFYEVVAGTDEPVVFDITHGYRDLVIMSVVATIVDRFMHHKQIDIVYARQTENGYRFVKEKSLIHISEWTYLLTTFKSTLNIPPELSIDDEFDILPRLKAFSADLMGNRIGKLLEDSFPRLYVKLKTAKISNLKPMKEIVAAVINEIAVFETIRKETSIYKKYFLFAKKMHEKHYHLIALTYLYEAIPHYLHSRLRQEGLFTEKELDYNFSGELKRMLKEEQGFTTIVEGMFVTLVGEVAPLVRLYESIRSARNNLAHLNESYEETDPVETLMTTFERLVIEEDILRRIHVRVTAKTAIDDLETEIERFWQCLGCEPDPAIVDELYRNLPKEPQKRRFDKTPKSLRTAKILNDDTFRRIITLQYVLLVQRGNLSTEKQHEFHEKMKRFKNLALHQKRG